MRSERGVQTSDITSLHHGRWFQGLDAGILVQHQASRPNFVVGDARDDARENFMYELEMEIHGAEVYKKLINIVT